MLPKSFLAALTFITIAISAPSAHSGDVRNVSSDIAEKGFTVDVVRGAGAIVNIAPSGEVIQHAWLSDPSQIVYKKQNGTVYLKAIKKLLFPGNLSADDGSSTLFILTRSGKVYPFRLIVKRGVPSYKVVNIIPSSSLKSAAQPPSATPAPEPTESKSISEPEANGRNATPAQPSAPTTSKLAPKSTIQSSATGLDQPTLVEQPKDGMSLASAIARGLQVAVSNQQIRQNSPTYHQVQSAIRLLRLNKAATVEAAAAQAGIKPTVLSQLNAWGSSQ